MGGERGPAAPQSGLSSPSFIAGSSNCRAAVRSFSTRWRRSRSAGATRGARRPAAAGWAAAAAALHRLDLGEAGFPEAQHVLGNVEFISDLADGTERIRRLVQMPAPFELG